MRARKTFTLKVVIVANIKAKLQGYTYDAIYSVTPQVVNKILRLGHKGLPYAYLVP